MPRHQPSASGQPPLCGKRRGLPVSTLGTATTLAYWLTATAATLVAIDPFALAFVAGPGGSLRSVLVSLGSILEPAHILSALFVLLVMAGLGRMGILGRRRRMRFHGPLSAAWSLFKAGLLATFAALCLKALIGRARPDGVASDWLSFDPLTADASFQSLPSAHAALAGALAVSAMRLSPRQGWIWLSLAGLAALSRVLGGDHWPSDIIAGLGLGALIGQTVSCVKDAPLPSRS